MYSRSISNPELYFANQHRATANSAIQQAQRIPVKSYSDSSAYEHFGNMGRSEPARVTETPNNSERNEEKISANDESFGITVQEEKQENKVADVLTVNTQDSADSKKEDNTFSEKTLHILKNLLADFSSDSILPILAVMIFVLGKDKSKHTLTPFALMAVMLL